MVKAQEYHLKKILDSESSIFLADIPFQNFTKTEPEWNVCNPLPCNPRPVFFPKILVLFCSKEFFSIYLYIWWHLAIKFEAKKDSIDILH